MSNTPKCHVDDAIMRRLLEQLARQGIFGKVKPGFVPWIGTGLFQHAFRSEFSARELNNMVEQPKKLTFIFGDRRITVPYINLLSLDMNKPHHICIDAVLYAQILLSVITYLKTMMASVSYDPFVATEKFMKMNFRMVAVMPRGVAKRFHKVTSRGHRLHKKKFNRQQLAKVDGVSLSSVVSATNPLTLLL